MVTGLSINAGMIGVKAYGTSPNGTRACPDLKLFYRYATESAQEITDSHWSESHLIAAALRGRF